MFFNYWIMFTNESYLFLGVCIFLNFNYFHFDSYGNALNSVISVILALGIVFFPFFVILFYNLKSNIEKITTRNSEFLERFGAVLEELNFDKID